jgi:hypothetical protein
MKGKKSKKAEAILSALRERGLVPQAVYTNPYGDTYAMAYRHDAALPYVSWLAFMVDDMPKFLYGHYHESRQACFADMISR